MAEAKQIIFSVCLGKKIVNNIVKEGVGNLRNEGVGLCNTEADSLCFSGQEAFNTCSVQLVL